MHIVLSAFAPEHLVSRDGFGSPVTRQPAHVHNQAESCVYLRDPSQVSRRRLFIYLNRHTPLVHSRVYRVTHLRTDGVHCREFAGRDRKPQGSSERVLPWPVTMDQLIWASLSHTHYGYEVGMLKVQAIVAHPFYTESITLY